MTSVRSSSSSSSFLLEELSAVVSALIGSVSVGASLSAETEAIVASAINGAKYGVKIRLPHALVMTFLFRKDLSPRAKIRTVLKLVVEHASNLAAFATIYKCALVVLKSSSRCIQGGVGLKLTHETQNISHGIKSLGSALISLVVDGSFSPESTAIVKAGEPERPYHSLLAGAAGGYIVWGRYSSVNHQIILYLASRILVGLGKRGWEYVHQRPGYFKGDSNSTRDSILQHPRTYPLVAATVWGIVMLLFEESPHVLHRSLKKSMDEIYRL